MAWVGVALGCGLAAAYGLVSGRFVAARLSAGRHRRYDDERARPAQSYRLFPVGVALACAAVAASLLTGWVAPDAATGAAPLPVGHGVADVTARAASALAYVAPVPLFAALGAVDRDVHRLPDRLTLPAYPLVAALLALASWAGGSWEALRRAVLGGALLVAVFAVLHVLSRGRFGLGDVKLAGPLGMALAWLSWGRLVGGAYAMFLVGGLAAVVLVARRRARRDTAIAFGPAMAAGALLGICLPG